MSACDAHGALHESRTSLSHGEGYLLDARFMQASVVQTKMLDKHPSSMSREDYRRYLVSMQGTSPWLVCDQCIGYLNLSETDKQAARAAARRWWADNNSPGHVPSTRRS